MFSAERCPEHQVEAFRMAITELKKTSNTQLYVDCVSRAREVLGEKLGDEWGLDEKWRTNTNRIATEKLSRLEVGLNNAKRDGDKEPIRKAFEALAEHYISRGDFTTALTKYLDSKNDNLDTLDTCLNIIKTSIFIGSMSDVKNQAGRARSMHAQQLKGFPDKNSQINAAMGLYNLKVSNYRAAADEFLSCTTDMEGKYSEVMSARDIGVYGALTALVSYNRAQLRDAVLNNNNFKSFLELVPRWRKILQDFNASKYTTCFQALELLKPDMQLDVYMAPHIHKITTKILDRALVQYFRPFTSVKLQSMAVAFGTEIPVLERQLAALIAENKIQARIDSHSKVLHARHADQRAATFEQALGVGNKYVRDCKSLLLRLSLVENDFVVRHAETRRKGKDKDDDEGKTKDR